jgi:hypothetical protein
VYQLSKSKQARRVALTEYGDGKLSTGGGESGINNNDEQTLMGAVLYGDVVSLGLNLVRFIQKLKGGVHSLT